MPAPRTLSVHTSWYRQLQCCILVASILSRNPPGMLLQAQVSSHNGSLMRWDLPADKQITGFQICCSPAVV